MPPIPFDPSRRALLARLGQAALFIPCVRLPRAMAASAARPRRLILAFNGTGTISESLWPTGGETDFAFPAGSILEPLAPIRSKVVMVANLQRKLHPPDPFGSHERNTADVFSGGSINPGNQFGGGGWAKYPSIDQLIAQQVPQPTPFHTLEFAAMPGEGDGSDQMQRIISAGSDQPVAPMTDPTFAFQRIFAGFGQSRSQQVADFNRKKSVLDVVVAQLGKLRTFTSTEDMVKVDRHLEAIRDLEASLQPGGAALASCTAPTASGQIDVNNQDNFPLIVGLMNNLLVRAMGCDMTRIASMQYSRGQCHLSWGWIGVNKEHHQMTHDNQPSDRVARVKIYRYYAEQVLSIAQALDALPDGDGTMMDNSVIAWCAESADPAQSHDPNGAPTVLVGSCGGAFRTGRYLANPGAPYYAKQVLVSLCQAMGATGVNRVGDDDYGDSGPLPTLA